MCILGESVGVAGGGGVEGREVGGTGREDTVLTEGRDRDEGRRHGCPVADWELAVIGMMDEGVVWAWWVR